MRVSELASGGSPLDDSGGLLEAFAASKQAEAAEQVRQVWLALQFCAFNSPDARHPAATLPGTDGALALAGEGAPEVAEFAVVEFGAVAGMSTEAARSYLGRCLELGHRLRLTWRATRLGRVPAWRALRIAEHTQCLPAEGAAWVDAQVAPVAGRVGPVVLARLVQEAVIRFDPETAALRALEALETRHATITLEQALTDLGAGVVATGRLEAVLDAVDALDLDAALADLAADLAEAGDTDTLEVRRAKALGLLARGEAVDLPEQAPQPPQRPQGPQGPQGPRGPQGPQGPQRPRRQVVLHLHLAQAALHGYGDGIATWTTPAGHPLGQVTVEQVQDWCHHPEATITVKPVLDLAALVSCTGYQPSARLREQVIAITPTCAFPYCDRPAENLDLDHITPYDCGGPTSSENLAPLCRRHHRAKTHGHWTYHRLGPGEYLWTSPHHHQWIRDQDGTRPVPTTTAQPVSTGPP